MFYNTCFKYTWFVLIQCFFFLMNGLPLCVFKVHDAVVIFLYLFRSGNWVYSRTKTFWISWCRDLLNLALTRPSNIERATFHCSLTQGAESTQPLPGLPFPHTPHLCSQQSFQPPTSQGCLLPHLYKHRASCHHVASSARLRMGSFKFLIS